MGTCKSQRIYRQEEKGNLNHDKDLYRLMKTLKEQALEQVLLDLQETNTNFLDNPFRLGSLMYFETIKEVRKLVAEQKYRLTEVDKQILETDLGEYEVYEGQLVPLDCPMMDIHEEEEPELNKPKRESSKKYYVYVRDPQTKNIKKVSWGDTTGLKVKLNDPKARKSFAL